MTWITFCDNFLTEVALDLDVKHANLACKCQFLDQCQLEKKFSTGKIVNSSG